MQKITKQVIKGGLKIFGEVCKSLFEVDVLRSSGRGGLKENISFSPGRPGSKDPKIFRKEVFGEEIYPGQTGKERSK